MNGFVFAVWLLFVSVNAVKLWRVLVLRYRGEFLLLDGQGIRLRHGSLLRTGEYRLTWAACRYAYALEQEYLHKRQTLHIVYSKPKGGLARLALDVSHMQLADNCASHRLQQAHAIAAAINTRVLPRQPFFPQQTLLELTRSHEWVMHLPFYRPGCLIGLLALVLMMMITAFVIGLFKHPESFVDFLFLASFMLLLLGIMLRATQKSRHREYIVRRQPETIRADAQGLHIWQYGMPRDQSLLLPWPQIRGYRTFVTNINRDFFNPTHAVLCLAVQPHPHVNFLFEITLHMQGRSSAENTRMLKEIANIVRLYSASGIRPYSYKQLPLPYLELGVDELGSE